MGISMWMLYNWLRAYHPVAKIQSREMRIRRIRVMSIRETTSPDPTMLYVWLENADDPHAARATVQLYNGGDFITLPNLEDTSQALNDLLDAFAYYRECKLRLRDAIDQHSSQALLDLATEILGNPMVMADMRGEVLAMSTAYRDEDINPAWVEVRDTWHLPKSLIGMPMKNENGLLTGWTDVPGIYSPTDGMRAIGAYFGNSRGYLGGVGVWEAKRNFLPGDLSLMEVFCEAATAIVADGETSAGDNSNAALYSASNILGEILSGREADDSVLQMLQLRFPGPWRLMLLHNPYYSMDQASPIQSYLLALLRQTALRCIPLLHDDYVLSLVQQDDVDRLLDTIVRTQDREQYLVACLSQPFADLHDINANYSMTHYLFIVANNQPGTYYGEQYGLKYIVYDTRHNRYHRVLHPAIPILRAYDAETGNTLYETLYQYLINERNNRKAAEALHVHRNSIQYRLTQINNLIELDLDDPFLRTYLILSFAIDEDNRKIEAERRK